MDFSGVLKQLNQASAFELFRLKCAIDTLIDEPARINQIRNTLLLDQVVEYYNPRLNKCVTAKIIKLGRTLVDLKHLDNTEVWQMPYAALNLQGVDATVHNQRKRGLSRNELAIGDTVCFTHEGRQLTGKVTRLNPKSVGVLCGKTAWRVGYGLLNRVMDGEAELYQPGLLDK